MKVQKKYFEIEEKRKIKNLKAIVVHWPAGRGVPEIHALWKWMSKRILNMWKEHKKLGSSYHYLISKDKIIQTRDTDYRALHCGHRTYRKKAKDFFGYNVCSDKDSPNNYTLGVCMLHDNIEGGYSTDTMDSSVEMLAELCIKFKLNPDTDLWRHSDITNEKDIPCPRAFFEDDDGAGADDLWNAFKCWVAVAITMRYEEINNIGNRHSQKHKNVNEER